jgi:hypothetical protein
MNPLVLYFLNLAQRAGNTPAGQRFLQMAQGAAEKATSVESKLPTMARGPMGRFPARPMLGDRTAVAPISRGAAGLAGAAGVGMGSGQFEGVRDRLYEGARAEPAIPQSLWGELDARAVNAPQQPAYVRQMDSSLFGEDPGPRPAPIRAADSTLAGYDAPAARAAVSTARNIVSPREAPMPPPRPVQQAPSPQANASRDLWERYNETGSAADFVRANAAMRGGYADGGAPMDPMAGLMPPDMATMPVDAPLPQPMDMAPPAPAMEPKAPAGGAGGKDAAINKALDIIHKLISGQRI